MTTPVVASKTPPPDSRPPSTPPPDNRPPNRPPSNPPPTNPPPTTLAAELDTASLLLRTIAVLRLPGMDVADRAQLDLLLRSARRVLASAQSPARRDLSTSAEGPAIATSGVPVAALPRAAAHAGGPSLPGVSDFCLPKAPGTQALMASLARRAD